MAIFAFVVGGGGGVKGGYQGGWEGLMMNLFSYVECKRVGKLWRCLRAML